MSLRLREKTKYTEEENVLTTLIALACLAVLLGPYIAAERKRHKEWRKYWEQERYGIY